MGLNEVPSGERVRIGFFGVRNAGKSSLVNAVVEQELAVVSDTPGTTTDAVVRNMELLRAGPVVIVDTPGIDDDGKLGKRRADRARRELQGCDVAVLVVDGMRGMQPSDEELVAGFERRGVPCLLAWNKADVAPPPPAGGFAAVSAATGQGVRELKERLARIAAGAAAAGRLVADLVRGGETAVLVAPIDASAPKGRVILPQQMVLRDLLDAHATALVCQPAELAGAFGSLGRPPALVVTDSQALAEVAAVVPQEVPLTSFSVLMARYKGDLALLAGGVAALDGLTSRDRVLVCEGCTHHRQCEDIGTVKIPAWVRSHVGASPKFDFTSGRGFPDELGLYSLVIHCGGCMLNGREMEHRLSAARAAGVPMVNYGMAIAQMHGLLERTLEPFARELGQPPLRRRG